MKKLEVKDSQLLSMILYGNNYDIANDKEANEVIKSLTDNLKVLYESLDTGKPIYVVDLYLIGDVINLLDNLRVKDGK